MGHVKATDACSFRPAAVEDAASHPLLMRPDASSSRWPGRRNREDEAGGMASAVVDRVVADDCPGVTADRLAGVRIDVEARE